MHRKSILFSALASAFIVTGCGGSSEDQEGEQVVRSSVTDPAPEFEIPGEYGCEG